MRDASTVWEGREYDFISGNEHIITRCSYILFNQTEPVQTGNANELFGVIGSQTFRFEVFGSSGL